MNQRPHLIGIVGAATTVEVAPHAPLLRSQGKSFLQLCRGLMKGLLHGINIVPTGEEVKDFLFRAFVASSSRDLDFKLWLHSL